MPNENPSTTIQYQDQSKRNLETELLKRQDTWNQVKNNLPRLFRPSNVILRKLEVLARSLQQKTWNKRADRIVQHRVNLRNAAVGFVLQHNLAKTDDWRNNITHYLRLLQAEGCGKDTQEGRSQLDKLAREVALEIREFQGDWENASALIEQAQRTILQSDEPLETKFSTLSLLERVSIRCRQEEMKEDLRAMFKQRRRGESVAWQEMSNSKRYSSLLKSDNEQAIQELREEGWECILEEPKNFRLSTDLAKAQGIWFHQGTNGKNWNGTCGLSCVAFVARLFGKSLTEDDVVNMAIEHRLCSEAGRTTAIHRKKLLQKLELDCEIELVTPNANWAMVNERLAKLVEGNHAVICGVNSGIFWDSPLSYGNGNTNHAVVLVGVVSSRVDKKPLGFQVLDSGMNDGKCRFIPSRWLQEAMLVSGGEFIYTTSPYPSN